MEAVTVLLIIFCVSGAFSCFVDSGLYITAPHTIEALTGSCLMIPCNFRTREKFISTRTIYGVWIKYDPRIHLSPNNVIYSSVGIARTQPMNITGNLRQRNCTTLFNDLNTTHTDKYYFGIENGAFRATDHGHPVQINVRDSPGSPRVIISGDLRENVTVTVTCSASTPCPHFPPKLTWNLQAEPDNHRVENTDGTFTTKIQETITLSDQHDGLTINCSASYPVSEGIKTAQILVTLNVSYAPKDTSASISPSAVVSAGSWVNLSCSSRARPPVSSFTWFQISADGATANVSEGAFYTFNATGGGVYYCVASNGLGAQTSAQLHLTVEGQASQVDVVHVTLKTILGLMVLLSIGIVCDCRFSPGSFNDQLEMDEFSVIQDTSQVLQDEQQLILLDSSSKCFTLLSAASHLLTLSFLVVARLVRNKFFLK